MSVTIKLKKAPADLAPCVDAAGRWFRVEGSCYLAPGGALVVHATAADGPGQGGEAAPLEQPEVVPAAGTGYTITHLPSGCAIMHMVKGLARVRAALAVLLDSGIDWAAVDPCDPGRLIGVTMAAVGATMRATLAPGSTQAAGDDPKATEEK